MHDHGKAFNPGTIKKPNLKANLNNRKRGGLGLHFMQSLMDSVEFTFNGQGGNILRMIKTKKDSENPLAKSVEKKG